MNSYIGVVPAYPNTPYDFTDKERLVTDYVNQFLTRTQSMFRYTGLPETIPQRTLELYLQIGGHVAVTRVNGDLYALQGGMGGEPDPNYMPTIYTVANPALAYSANLKIGTDCIVVPSDSLYQGLLPLMSRYGTMLAENDVSMRMMDINSRVMSVMAASDTDTKTAAEKFLHDVLDGKLGVIGDKSLWEGGSALSVQPFSTTGSTGMFTGLIEYHQYLKAGFYNEIGLNANYNMKREAINSDESQLNKDALLPLVDDMLNCRQDAIEKINTMYGTDIMVSLSSSWEDIREEINTGSSDGVGGLSDSEHKDQEPEGGDPDADDA